MNKYIVKNCPAIIETTFKNRMCYKNYGEDCQNIDDCLIKQVIEKSRKHADYNTYCGHCSIESLGYSIVDMFEIENVEE